MELCFNYFYATIFTSGLLDDQIPEGKKEQYELEKQDISQMMDALRFVPTIVGSVDHIIGKEGVAKCRNLRLAAKFYVNSKMNTSMFESFIHEKAIEIIDYIARTVEHQQGIHFVKKEMDGIIYSTDSNVDIARVKKDVLDTYKLNMESVLVPKKYMEEKILNMNN
jgi:hypothetical protein